MNFVRGQSIDRPTPANQRRILDPLGKSDNDDETYADYIGSREV